MSYKVHPAVKVAPAGGTLTRLVPLYSAATRLWRQLRRHHSRSRRDMGKSDRLSLCTPGEHSTDTHPRARIVRNFPARSMAPLPVRSRRTGLPDPVRRTHSGSTAPGHLSALADQAGSSVRWWGRSSVGRSGRGGWGCCRCRCWRQRSGSRLGRGRGRWWLSRRGCRWRWRFRRRGRRR